jgi:hypothetical protein
MWRWSRQHAFALALSLAVLVCPRPWWDALRLGMIAPLERLAGKPAGEAHDRTDACQACRAVSAALGRAEAARADASAQAARMGALREVVPARDAPRLLIAHFLGGEGAAAGANGGSPLRGGRARLDQGAASGLAPGDPVLWGDALVGRIVAANEASAEVLLVTAPTLRVRARCVPRPVSPSAQPAFGGAGATTLDPGTAVAGIVRGDGEGHMVFRPDGSDAPAPGDIIVASPRSGFCPGGVVLGTVIAVERDPASRLALARVEPAAPLDAVARVVVPLSAERAMGSPGSWTP